MTQNVANGDRPLPEIEITPDMVEVGAEALAVFDGGYMETRATGAERIYRAMQIAKVAGREAGLRVLEESF